MAKIRMKCMRMLYGEKDAYMQMVKLNTHIDVYGERERENAPPLINFSDNTSVDDDVTLGE